MIELGYGENAHLIVTYCSVFNIQEISQVDLLYMRDLILSCDYSSNYILNISHGGSITSVIFDNCDIHTFRGVFRIKASDPMNIKNINYVNCVIDSINGYGVMNVDNSN